MSNKLFDAVMKHQGLKNAAQLSRALQVDPAALSRMRHGHLKVGATLIIRIHELTNEEMSVKDIKAMLEDAEL